MAVFAKLDENSIVTEVHMLSDDVAVTEKAGIDFLKQLLGSDTNWKQTIKDGTRKNYAGIGMKYDETRDAFIPRKFTDSWVLNEDTCRWEAPIPKPDDGKEYIWNESTLSWDIMIH